MQYYKPGSSQQTHETQEKQVVLEVFGLASMPLEVLEGYYHHKWCGTGSYGCFPRNTTDF